MNLATAFAIAVARQPGAEAIVDGERRRTFSAWEREVRSVAGGLARLGLKAGDRLVVVLKNRLETATLYWACHWLGVVFTPLNWRATAAELAYVVADAEAAALACEGVSEEAAHGCTIPRIAVADAREGASRYADLADAPAFERPADIDARATCLMLYTSGTTGRPKGVPRSHAAELAAAVSQIAHNRYGFGESALGVMPLYHTMGIRVLLASALLNGKFVCLPAWEPEQALRLLAAERIGSLFLVPTLYFDLLRHPRFDAADLGALRKLGYAGMTMTDALTAECLARFRPDQFVNYYGSSEIYTFSFCDRLDRKPGCAGRAGLNQELRVVPADPAPTVGPDERVAPGEAGEIVATMQSAEAFAGYWKRPDADAKAIRQGWYFTGDLGRFDDEGELYVVGRVDDMIVSGGENIHPEEVENALAACPLVRRVAVAGLPDDRWGQKVVAFVEPAGAADAAALDRFCAASALARFKRPRDYVFVERIPQSPVGKILRRELRAGNYRTLRTKEQA